MSFRCDDDIDRLFNRERPIDILRINDGKEDPRDDAEVRRAFAIPCLVHYGLHRTAADRAVNRQLEESTLGWGDIQRMKHLY